ncbi:MAG: alpha/beta hydrolase [Gammaproteobacteria bacterium]|nr:MAG: alpha/beta hydrolase [Gammaproteobacteria bacterium]
MTASNALAGPTKAHVEPRVPIAPLHEPITAFVPFENAPFPFGGRIPDSGKHFLDHNDGARKGHVSSRDGSVHWEDTMFNDNRVLLYFPKGFDVRKPALIIVFFHGNGATLSRDVLDRQQVAAQVAASGLNAVLVAPQFAVDGADSSAGRFWQRGHFAKFVDESAKQLAAQYHDRRVASAFAHSKIVLVAYSGGYLPAAWSVAIGKADNRVAGVVLFDAMYGQLDKFASWIEAMHARTFFFSAYGESTHEENEALKSELDDVNLRYKTAAPKKLAPGSVTFVDAGPNVKHDDFITQAWTQNPLAWVLSRVPGYPRAEPKTKHANNRVPAT